MIPADRNRFRGWFGVALLLGCLALPGGCSHYQLGRHAEPPFQSVYVKPVSNASFAPQAQAILTLQIREAFLHDGLLQVDNEDEADATLEIVLVDFRSRVAGSRVEDTEIAEKLRLELGANCTLSDSRTGKVYFKDRPVSATADSFPGDRSQQAEYQAMPVLTQNLARRIAYEVLQVW